MAMKCGDEYIIAAAGTQIEVVQRLWERAREIRSTYIPDLPRCRPMFTVDPLGSVMVYKWTGSRSLTSGD
jgi:hypothetical protein